MGVREWFRRREPVQEATTTPARLPERSGYEIGIPRGGLTEYSQGMGVATQSDRQSLMTQLYEAYLACPWAWASVNAIARTVTAGGLTMDWDNDDGEGDQEEPEKPENVQALERLFAYCNEREDIRQLLRGVVTDLLVFGDAFLEVVWVGNIPAALYSLDSPTMRPLADEHGRITGYVQITDYGQRAEFDPRDVIHISMDSPRSGIFGVSPTQAMLLPITAWLFAAATAKEVFRKGNPPHLHIDFPESMKQVDINRWDAQYAQRNLGPRNIGMPVYTKGGAAVKELQMGRVADYIQFLDQKRDEILAGYGVPPAEAGVIESGNIGGGTGESQRKTFLTNTCQPIAELVLEKINYHLAKVGFGVEGWHVRLAEVDMRDSKTVEDIRDMRLRNGSWTLNRYRVDISEPPVDGGDEAVLVDRQNMVLWRDMEANSQAGIAAKLRGSDLEPGEPQAGQPLTLQKPEPAPVPAVLKPFAGVDNNPTAHGQPEEEPPVETAGSAASRDLRALIVEYERRRAQALEELPCVHAGNHAA